MLWWILGIQRTRRGLADENLNVFFVTTLSYQGHENAHCQMGFCKCIKIFFHHRFQQLDPWRYCTSSFHFLDEVKQGYPDQQVVLLENIKLMFIVWGGKKASLNSQVTLLSELGSNSVYKEWSSFRASKKNENILSFSLKRNLIFLTYFDKKGMKNDSSPLVFFFKAVSTCWLSCLCSHQPCVLLNF